MASEAPVTSLVEQASERRRSVADVVTSDGSRLTVEEHGCSDERGETLVLLNGLFCTSEYYAPLVPKLGRRRRVVTWDYRGHGRSADVRDPASVTIDRLADDALEVLRHVGSAREPVVLVAHSMGVRVALEAWRAARELVSAMVLVCGSVDEALGSRLHKRGLVTGVRSAIALGHRNPTLTGRIKQLVARSGIVPGLARALGGMSDDSPRSSIDALLANIERMDPRALLHLAASYVDHTARPLLRHVDVPVLVVAGEQDSLAPPEHCTAVVRELRRSQLWIAKGRTHLAPLEEPDAFVEQVDAFLASVGVER